MIMSGNFLHILDTVAVCGGLLYVWLRSRRKGLRGLPHPPGPRGLPFIGNYFDMPEKEEWVQAKEWGKQYGDLVYVENFGTPFLFINSAKVVYELFEKRGQIYSSRPQMNIVNLSGWSWALGFTPYGEEHRKIRLRVHRFFHASIVARYHDLTAHAAHQLLTRLYRNPDGFLKYTRQCAGEQIMKIAYGHEVKGDNDPYIELAEEGLEIIAEAMRPYIVNMLPFLQYLPSWFPGAGFKAFAEHSRTVSSDMLNNPYYEVKRAVLKGTAEPSMARDLIEEHLANDGTEEDEEIIKKALGIVYVAGADTTVSATQTFFLAMVLNPEVQKRGQEEIDRVVGGNSLPTINDRPNLPYINAILNETLRWQPVTPLSLLRTVTEDDVYNGYHIPAGTVVCPNVWAMLRNPDEYKNPDDFNPDRWLQDNPPTDANKFAFGFGRRICVGRYFAENSLFSTIASVLAVFNIEKACDEHGNVITPSGEYTPGGLRYPVPFKCRPSVRSNKEELISVILDSVDSKK